MKQATCIKTRKATPQDACDIATIHVLAWQQSYKHILPPTVLNALDVNQREQNWRHRIAEGLDVIVIEDGSEVLGFVSLCSARDDDLNPEKYGEISTMYVHPDACRKGIGTKLFEAALSKLKLTGFTDVVLWVACENIRARKFYEAMDLSPTGIEKTETLGCRTCGEASDEVATRDSDITFQEIRYHMRLIANK